MKVYTYYPNNEEGMKELRKKVANVHAESVRQTLKELKCSKEQKKALLDDIVKEAKAKSAADKDDCR